MAAWMSRAIMILLFWCISLAAMAQAPATAPATAPEQPLLRTEELDQLVASIALYPDPLLSQVLIAATYPLEVVQADRWATQNKNLKGDQLKTEADKQAWDDSVKSLVATPSVLTMMSTQLEWTQELGDAVLAQQPDVMDAIQRLRSKAHENKKLTSTKEQIVTVKQEPNKQVIVIEPAQPDTIHVPYYDPAVVYGGWPYPAYPPYYWPPPSYIAGGILATGVAFGAGYALARWRTGGNYWGGGVNWGNNNLIVNRPVNVNNIGNNWQHNPAHRHGVKYNNAGVRQNFARTDVQAGKAARQDFRGKSGQQVLDPGRAGAGDRAKAGDRPGTGDRAKNGDRAKTGAGDRAKTGDRGGAGKAGGKKAVAKQQPSRPSGASSRQRDTAFSGSNSGAAARSHADRGRQSVQRAGGAARVSGGGGGPRVGGGGGGRGRRSDVALKHDIVLLGHLDNGLGFYRFSYLGSDKAYVGVMAQDVQAVVPEAVVRGRDGYLRVYYDKLGLKLQTYERWIASGARIPVNRTVQH